MSQIKDQASVVGRVHARLKDASGPMTIRQLVGILSCSPASVMYATKVLRDRGILRRVPYRPVDGVGSERYGWEYIRPGEKPKITVPSSDIEFMNLKAAFTEDDVSVRILPDCCWRITGNTARIILTADINVRLNALSQASSSILSNCPGGGPPAFTTRPSIRP